jgi:hypothetical protein
MLEAADRDRVCSVLRNVLPHVRLWEGGEIRILIADAVREVAKLLPDVILLDLSAKQTRMRRGENSVSVS